MHTSNHFPKMLEVRQEYPPSPPLELRKLLEKRFQDAGVLAKLAPGSRVAVGVGSRGISNLKEIVEGVVGILRQAGAKPFIIPAMGSHGGATPEGQEKVLAGYGISRETMGVPFETSMEVQQIGKTERGIEVFFSSSALQADAILIINRVKPHTDFRGDLGSGIRKMLVIGLGKQKGAATTHGAAARLGHEVVLRESSEVIVRQTPFLAGVAILEDQHHQTADVEVIGAENLAREDELLVKAKSLMPRLPFATIDLLIVDQIGKEISGAGMDPNVIGRGIDGYTSTLRPAGDLKPQIFRIFVRNLTAATNGNGVGIGLADFTTTRTVNALNLRYTYINGLTSLGLQPVKIPIYFDTDHEVLTHAISSLALSPLQTPRIVHISNTLNLEHLLISESLADEARGQRDLTLLGEAREMVFNESGNLLPLPESSPDAKPSSAS